MHLQQTAVYNSTFGHPEELWRSNLEHSVVPEPGTLGHCLRFQKFDATQQFYVRSEYVQWIQYSS